MAKSITLTNDSVLSIIQDPAMKEHIPSLHKLGKKLKKKLKGCNCSGRKSHVRGGMIQDAKAAIAGLPSGSKEKLKKILNVEEIHFYVGKKMVKI